MASVLPSRARRVGWSIRRRLLVAYAVLAVATVAVVVSGALFLSRLDHAVNRRAGLLQPAEIRTSQLVSALLDQETGIRGYAITGNMVNLAPYQQGLADQARLERSLRAQFSDDPGLQGDLSVLITRASQWHDSYAEPLIQRVRTQGAATANAVNPLAGKTAFDQIRVAAQSLNTDLGREALRARSQVTTAFAVLLSLLVTSLVVLALAVIAVYVATRRWVVIPLEVLSADAQAVSEGDLAHVVSVTSGPPDIRDLADDVDAMRLRLLDELESVELARRETAAAAELLRAQAGDLERSNRDLEQFAYVASHDLQEPLRKVASFCQLLERRYSGQLDERGEQYIAFAVDGAKRMQQLIADLLAFSRVGRTADSFEPVELRAAVNRSLAALAGSLEASGGQVEVGALPTVRGDLGLLGQLFQNLIGNAVKFHGDAPPLVLVSAEQIDGEWIVTIADNGIGVEANYSDKIFVIFQRLHARDSAYTGTGIGLALCRRIVEFHGGRIWLDTSHQPPGAVFRIALPVIRAD